MADEDARRGARALVSGGMGELPDDAVQSLLESAVSTQRDRGAAPTIDELAYLQKYVEICELFVGAGCTLREANAKVDELNEKYPSLKGKRSEVIGADNLVAGEDGWAPSQVCW
jgi:hypothetical protein